MVAGNLGGRCGQEERVKVYGQWVVWVASRRALGVGYGSAGGGVGC